MHLLAERVLGHIRRQELLRAGERVGVAVSGGIDSVALLRLLLELRSELGIVISVVHFNHKLRGAEADGDERFVAELAREFDLEYFGDSDDVAGHAREEGVSVEAAARELRYGFFRSLLVESPSGAKAPAPESGSHRSAGSAAPPKGSPAKAASLPSDPQGLKPDLQRSRLRGPEGPLFHGPGKAAFFPDTPIHFLNKIATGHTLDDQAETVLMRIVRGSGLRGMAGIYPRIAVEDSVGEICGEIVRPLLAVRRNDLQEYLHDLGQSWREDSTNADASITRNRVRKLVLPLLEKEFNPAVAENLAELAEIARGEEDYWENEIAGWMGTVVHWVEPEWARDVHIAPDLVQIGAFGKAAIKTPSSRAGDAPDTSTSLRGTMGQPEMDHLQSKIDSAPWLVANASVSRAWLVREPLAVQRRIVKAIGEQAGIPLEFKHVEEILRFAAEEGAGKELSLPLGWKLAREPEQIVFLTPDLREPAAARDYERELPAGGKVAIAEIGLQIELQHIPAEAAVGLSSELLLDAASLRCPLKVRNWRAGDRFWPPHTKSAKKIKELLQERHVPQPERKLWPVVESGDDIVWLRGFPVPAKFRARPGHEAMLILERRLVAKSPGGESSS